MQQATRREFELHYTAERNCEMLLAIYERARGRLKAEPALKLPRGPL